MELTGDARVIDIGIEGMHCASCVARVERGLEAVPGVRDASVNLATGRARVRADAQIDVGNIVSAIEAAGYQTRTDLVRLTIEGMSCASCVGRVERALRALPGVVEATVNLAAGTATVRLVAGTVTSARLIAAIGDAGYAAKLTEDGTEARAEREAAREREAEDLKGQVILAGALTLPIVIIDMGSHLVPAFHGWLLGMMSQQTIHIILFVLASLVLFGPGRQFLARGWPALRRLAPDMNSLVMLGTSAAWGYSVVATFLPGLLPAGSANVYFEASAVIVTLILLGRWLEA
ncbi:MAG TPA: copper ion binding protein, partial [Paracoccaceae bacterium]|nr:copper ion binding protein [Paracoccaceae bacterium]